MQQAHCLIDAYDNYESYIPWASPLHALWRRALRKADAVTAAGPQLADWMGKTAQRMDVRVVPMAADSLFVPLDRDECRQRLGLPLGKRLVGYAGSLHPNRGIGFLFDVFARLREIDSRIGLVLSGRLAKGVTLPEGVHWLGYRPAKEVPLILNSLDIQLVINKPGNFGDYSYPAKLYEAMACGIPVVASDVAGTRWILHDHPEMLARAGDLNDFVDKAIANLALGRFEYSGVQGWDYSANLIEAILSGR
jgi:glycosyltransferase involved in cell wall biosynthesis